MAGCPQAMDSAICAYVCKVKCVSNMWAFAQYQPDCAVWCCGDSSKATKFSVGVKKEGC